MTDQQEEALVKATRQDLIYQELLKTCEDLDCEYLRIKASLSKEDQVLLERYIAVCEDLEYRRTCLAANLTHA